MDFHRWKGIHFFGCFTLLLIAWVRSATNQFTRMDIGVAVPAAVICALLRPDYALVIFWLFVSVAMVRKWGEKVRPFLVLLFLIGAISVFIMAWEDLMYRGFEAIEPTARASRFNYFEIQPHTDVGFEQFKHWVPLGALLGIVGPMPHELFSRPVFIPFFLEGTLILLFPLLVYLIVNRKAFLHRKRFNAIFLWCFMRRSAC